jgi:hypothetical protein
MIKCTETKHRQASGPRGGPKTKVVRGSPESAGTIVGQSRRGQAQGSKGAVPGGETETRGRSARNI